MGAPLLLVEGVKASYGNIPALNGVDLEVRHGEIVSLIGANGAGKSTLMMTICGDPRAREGRIVFDGRDITDLPTHEIVHARIAQSPEGRRIFPRMTVCENLQMGASVNGFRDFEHDARRVFDLFPILEKRQGQRGGTLSGGEQQMLAIGRALMSRPRLLLLDEPSLGPRAADCEADFRRHSRSERERGIDGLPRRTERISCLATRPSRLRAGERGRHDARLRQGTAFPAGSAQRLLGRKLNPWPPSPSSTEKNPFCRSFS